MSSNNLQLNTRKRKSFFQLSYKQKNKNKRAIYKRIQLLNRYCNSMNLQIDRVCLSKYNQENTNKKNRKLCNSFKQKNANISLK